MVHVQASRDSLSSLEMTEVLMNTLVFVRSRCSGLKVKGKHGI